MLTIGKQTQNICRREADGREADGKSEAVAPIAANDTFPALRLSAAIRLLTLVALAIGFSPRQADAIPSFARQTGQPCASCHTAFPQLTPFGRRFKLGGYTLGGGLTATSAGWAVSTAAHPGRPFI